MLFQTLDDKDSCVAYYLNDKFQKEYQEEMSHSWTAPVYLRGLEIEYAYLYSQRSLEGSCPEHLKAELNECMGLLRAYMTSFVVAKLDMKQHCFFDLVPEHFLKRFCQIKNKICSHIFNNIEKPDNYDFLRSVHEICQDISNRKVSLDFDSLSLSTLSRASRGKFLRLKGSSPYIRYNMFGSKTGRFATKPNSLPILNLNKEFRSVIKPTNDVFVELDYNAFELRILLFLLGKEQPGMDMHEWNRKNVYHNSLTRSEAKTRIFSWLYNPESRDTESEDTYDRASVVSNYWDGAKIVNPFGRKINSDKFHALSYLIQSTAVDLVMRQMIDLHKLLQSTKSHIAFTIHDSVIIDMSREDAHLIPSFRESFSLYKGEYFLTNVSIGKDFGNMESIAC